MNDDQRIQGRLSQLNVDYLRELKELDKEFARVGVLTYFLVTRLKIYDTRAMLRSQGKQKKLIQAAILGLKECRLCQEYEPVFRKDIDQMWERCRHVYNICERNLKDTEHWPYFEKVGFDKLLEIDCRYSDGEASELDKLLPDMEAWEADHQEEIAAYMESIKARLETHRIWKEKKIAEAKAEKETRKAAKKAEDAEVREIRKNQEYWKKRNRELQRDLDRTVKRVHGGWNGQPL